MIDTPINPFMVEMAKFIRPLALTNYKYEPQIGSPEILMSKRVIGPEIMRHIRSESTMHEEYQRLVWQKMMSCQGELAPTLFDALVAHGESTVKIEYWSHDNPSPPWYKEVGVMATINGHYMPPLVMYPIVVSSHTFQISDWQCEYCGCWNSGTKTPYICPRCQAPRRKVQ